MADIEARLDAVDFLREHGSIRGTNYACGDFLARASYLTDSADRLCGLLKKLPDLARLIPRIHGTTLSLSRYNPLIKWQKLPLTNASPDS
jgi:hypothetical protein